MRRFTGFKRNEIIIELNNCIIVKSTCFKQMCQLLLSLIIIIVVLKNLPGDWSQSKPVKYFE